MAAPRRGATARKYPEPQQDLKLGEFQYRFLRAVLREPGSTASTSRVLDLLEDELGQENVRFRINPGQFYLTAGRLIQFGFLEEKGRGESAGKLVKMYAVTQKGKEAVEVARRHYEQLAKLKA